MLGISAFLLTMALSCSDSSDLVLDDVWTKKVLCLLFHEGLSDKDFDASRLALVNELERIEMQGVIYVIHKKEDLIRVIASDTLQYDGIVLDGHAWPGVIDSDPKELQRKEWKDWYKYPVQKNVDITESFLKKARPLFRRFTKNNLTDEANILIFWCHSWDTSAVENGKEYRVRKAIAQSLAECFTGHRVGAPLYEISTTGNQVFPSGGSIVSTPIYTKNFLCRVDGSLWFNINSFVLEYTDTSVQLKSENRYAIKNGIITTIDIGLERTREATKDDFPRFYCANNAH